MNGKLWDFYNGEPYLGAKKNPVLEILNPRGGKKVAKPKKGVMPPALLHYWQNKVGGGKTLAKNPPSHKKSKKRRHRRNPFSMGGKLPFLPITFGQLAIGGGAVIAQPYAENWLLSFLPASMAGTTEGRWGVRLAVAVGIVWGAQQTMGRDAAMTAAISLGAVLVNDAAAEWSAPRTAAPQIQTGVAGMLPVGRRGMNGMLPVGRRGLNGGLVLPNTVMDARAQRNAAVLQLPFPMTGQMFRPL